MENKTEVKEGEYRKCANKFDRLVLGFITCQCLVYCFFNISYFAVYHCLIHHSDIRTLILFFFKFFFINVTLALLLPDISKDGLQH